MVAMADPEYHDIAHQGKEQRLRQQIEQAREKYPHGAGWSNIYRRWEPLARPHPGNPRTIPLDSKEPCPECDDGVIRDPNDGRAVYPCLTCSGTGLADSIIQRIRTGRWEG